MPRLFVAVTENPRSANPLLAQGSSGFEPRLAEILEPILE